MKVTWLDCTLRDGGYYTNWSYNDSLLKKYFLAVNDIPLDYIEVGLRQVRKDTYRGPYAYCHEKFLNRMLTGLCKPIAVMVDAKELISDVEKNILGGFCERKKSKISLVRIACNHYEIAPILGDIRTLKDLGYKVVINLMQASLLDDFEVYDFIGHLPQDIECLYFADSLGNMVPKDVERVMELVRAKWSGPVGFHAHNNMGQASINVEAALNCGVSWIDSTITGMGRGAGNYETEVYLQSHVPDASSSIALVDAVENVFQPLKNKLGWGRSMFYELGAKLSIHPTYIQRLISLTKLDTHGKISCIKELAKLETPNKFSEQELLSSLAHASRSQQVIRDKIEPMDFSNVSVILVVNNPEYKIDIQAVSTLAGSPDWRVFSINHCPFIKNLDGVFALRNLNFTSLIDTLRNIDKPIISHRESFSDIPDIDIKYNASYQIGDRYDIDEDGFIELREELTIIYATLYCWWCGARQIYWIGADGKSLDPKELREMSGAISDLKRIGINIESLSDTSHDLPFRCHWDFYD